MRKITSVMFVVLLMAVAVAMASDKPWFDMENCAFCKALGADQSMMMELGWEHYNIDNGSLTVSTIPEKYSEKWETIRADWKALGEKMMAGEKMELCGMCTSYGTLLGGGAKMSEIKWSHGYISMMTSDDPAVVKKIHAHIDMNNAELKMMEEKMKMEGEAHDMGHEGHGK